MGMNFIAVDVETANWLKSSICQIGWTTVVEGRIAESDSVLINPRTFFDPFNVAIHGITPEMVEGCPSFPEVKEDFRRVMGQLPVLSYGLFDQAAFDLADDGDPNTSFVENTPWINAQRIVRRAWPDLFSTRYALSHVAKTLGLELRSHDAGSDAKVLAEIVLMATEKLGMTFDELAIHAYQRRSSRSSERINLSGFDGGPLSGQCICFTGALEMTRREAAELANRLGATIESGVTKKTTILVVGTQDPNRIIGDKSGKHRKAEQLVQKGQVIEIVTEADFRRMADGGR